MENKQEFKEFRCKCGYVGIRTNDNLICKRCGKEGKLIELLKCG
jgi:hypothetical protein